MTVRLSRGSLLLLRKAGRAIPLISIHVQALIDTGSQMSVVDARKLAPMVNGLRPAGFECIDWLVGSLPTNAAYALDLSIGSPEDGSNLDLPDFRVAEVPDLTSKRCEAIIGRDILARCAFLYDGCAESATLSY